MELPSIQFEHVCFILPNTVYDVLKVTRSDKECATAALVGSDYLDHDGKYTMIGQHAHTHIQIL